jgi:hypothetical protein
MWAVIGIWHIDPDLIDTIRDQIPLMASSKMAYPGFVHGIWTMDAHAILVFADEQSARHYHDSVLAQGALDRPGIRGVRWDLTEVGAESDTTGWTDRAGSRHTAPVPYSTD